ncbi:fungal-specific transcription factor domain-containing protein [Xylogone sp. PMI_703]|nr:fungal-specific transcription factor domain-containing protein [Xylogone sp. PMI_703]
MEQTTMPPPPKGRGVKASAFACTNCSRRKRKCDARRPLCTPCRRRDAECVYPIKRGLGAIEDRLNRMEESIARLEQGQDDLRHGRRGKDGSEISEDHSSPSNEGQPYERDRDSQREGLVRTQGGGKTANRPHECIISIERGSKDGSQTLSSIQSPPLGQLRPGAGVDQWTRPAQKSPTSSVSLHGIENTSTNLQSNPYQGSSSIRGQNRSGSETDDMRDRLAANANTQKDLEPVVLLTYTVGLPDAPHELYRYLLDSYWTWIQPIWSFVYFPAFIRGMSEQASPYFSSFLFHAILAHSTRFCCSQPAMKGYETYVDYFWIKARSMVLGEIEKSSSVATVQGLLLLSAIENSRGRVSQSWTFSGMAFRMLQDLNIHLDGTNPEIEKFTEIDLEVRRRLWWSSYLWDKMISVYFGRAPVLQQTPSAPPRLIVDDSTEFDPWIPLGVSGSSFVPRPGYGVSNFIAACRAAEVLDRVLARVHNHPNSRPVPHTVNLEDQALMRDAVRLIEDLPETLRVGADEQAPIHHIACLNCFIHAVVILAHRPHCTPYFFRVPSIASTCLTSAKTIIRIVQALFVAYGDCKFNIIAYAVWTAASIFVLQLQTFAGVQSQYEIPTLLQGRDDAVKLAITAKGMLDNICQYCTGIKHITSILGEQLAKLGVDTQALPQYNTHTPLSLLQAMTGVNEVSLGNMENADLPVDFELTYDGRDEFMESLMNSFLN